MADVRDDICELRKDMDIVKKQTVYNYDKIIDNYAAIRELQTVVEGKVDKPRLVQQDEWYKLRKKAKSGPAGAAFFRFLECFKEFP